MIDIRLTYSMQVCIGVLGHVEVEDDVDSFNINTTTKYVGGHQKTFFELFEKGEVLGSKRNGKQILESEKFAFLIIKKKIPEKKKLFPDTTPYF